jgi:glycerol-3-phosphate acyltransferase PlsY
MVDLNPPAIILLPSSFIFNFMTIWLTACATTLLMAYLLGSIPTGYMAAKLLKGIDIREVGSGSTGATNVLRTLGKGPGAFVLFIDCLKGVLAILLIYWLFQFGNSLGLGSGSGSNIFPPEEINTQLWLPWMVTAAGISAVLGHSKSIFLGFTGGKSVATSLGVLLAICWQVGLATFGVFAIVMAISRIVSLSSICGAIAVAILMVVFQQPLAYVLFGIATGLYVIIRHQSNIQRLLAGTEPKIGQKLQLNTEETITSSS